MSSGMQVKYTRSSISIFIKLKFLQQFFKNTQTSYFKKIHPMGADLFQVGWQMDRHDEANTHFSQFGKHS
jgi:hypothetical protein